MKKSWIQEYKSKDNNLELKKLKKNLNSNYFLIGQYINNLKEKNQFDETEILNILGFSQQKLKTLINSYEFIKKHQIDETIYLEINYNKFLYIVSYSNKHNILLEQINDYLIFAKTHTFQELKNYINKGVFTNIKIKQFFMNEDIENLGKETAEKEIVMKKLSNNEFFELLVSSFVLHNNEISKK